MENTMKKKFSAETRRKMSESQRARWARRIQKPIDNSQDSVSLLNIPRKFLNAFYEKVYGLVKYSFT